MRPPEQEAPGGRLGETRPMATFSKVTIFGVEIDDLVVDQLIGYGAEVVKKRIPATFAYVNVHVLNTAYQNAGLARFLNEATLVYCDGFGVRLGAALKGKRLKPRITGADWIYPYCRRAAKEGHRIFIIAGKQGVADRAAEILVSRFPGLAIAGTSSGYLDPGGSAKVVDRIHASRADVVFVGMGTPRQEEWIGRHRSQIQAPLVWAVGALFDFVAGVEERGSAPLVSFGLEWLARLKAQPGRLWRRYLIGNPIFLSRVLKETFRGKRI